MRSPYPSLLPEARKRRKAAVVVLLLFCLFCRETGVFKSVVDFIVGVVGEISETVTCGL